jgi:hypothetical protein
MKTEIKKEKKFRKGKDYFVALLGIIGILYMLNFGFGVVEILPDNLPFIGNMDEAAALLLIYSSAEYFGLDIKGFFKKK